MSIQQVKARLGQQGVVAIIRGDYERAEIHDIAETLYEAGIGLLEVTLNTTGALSVIEDLCATYRDRLCIGAGTVRTLQQAKDACAAGASYLISPNLNTAVVDYAISHDVLHLPGVLTPTEVQEAIDAGASLLKLFPIDSLGIGYMKALKAPFDDVDFVPTGGVHADNIADFKASGAFAVALGSALVKKGRSLSELHDIAQACVSAW